MLKIHFLNVGHGDCTLIEHHSGRLTMVDINNSQNYDSESRAEFIAEARDRNPAYRSDSSSVLSALDESARRELTDPISYMKKHYPGRRLFRFILTHPDMDHMRGLKNLHENVGFTNFWDTAHTKEISDFWATSDREDWGFYQDLRAGRIEPKPKHYHRGDEHYAFAKEENGRTGGDEIEILSPTPTLISSCNSSAKSNDLSYVLRIRHGGTSVILAGDVEKEGWDRMVTAYGADLRCSVLKASHHGRDSGHHAEALGHMKPRAVVLSVGRKPSTDAHRKYHAQSGRVFSTRHYGNIRLEIADDGKQRWIVERNA